MFTKKTILLDQDLARAMMSIEMTALDLMRKKRRDHLANALKRARQTRNYQIV